MGEHCTQGRSRAQSSVISVVLVFGIVVAGSTLTIALGAEAFSSTNDRLESDRAEQSMTQLDSKIAMTALGNSDVKEIELSGSGNDYLVENDTGTMTVSYTNTTNGRQTTIFSQQMGAIVYENGDTDIAYQGGGVWRLSEGGGATMISPPEFHYRDATLTLPLVTVSGDRSLGSSAVVRQNNTRRHFPNQTMNANFTNPLEGSRVTVTVESRFYEAWGGYFEERTDGEVSYDHPNNEVTIELVAPVDRPSVSSATASLAAGGSFSITGSSKSACSYTSKTYTDSYNSTGTSNDYCSQADAGTTGNEGDIVYGNDVDISSGAGNSDIHGDLVSGGSITVGNGGGQPDVHGHINYTDSCPNCAGRIVGSGSVSQIGGLETTPSVTQTVVKTVERLSHGANNSNGATSVIDADRLDNSGTLTAGNYYFQDLRVDASETLTLDTSGGDIKIAVRGQTDLDSDIVVTGDGTVRVFALGAGYSNDLTMSTGSAIRNAGDDAPQFRLFGPANYSATIGDGSNSNPAKFVGVIYAPPGSTSPSNAGNVAITGGEVFGGIVTGETTVDKGSIHYDEALENEEMTALQTDVVRVTYLHISTNDVIVESG